MKIKIISMICSILQIVGLVMIALAKSLPNFTPVLIGIAGFASIVKYFLPDAESDIDKTLRPIAAFAGLGVILIACIM